MYNIVFYRDKTGVEPVKEYILELLKQSVRSKDNKIRVNKIQDYIKVLQIKGTYAGEPYMKYMGNEIWELRPLRERIFFFLWNDGTIVLLHHYYKRTEKTPRREIIIARKRKNDFIERMKNYE